MPYPVILAVLEGNEQDTSVLEAALAAAAGGPSHITALHVRGDARQMLALPGLESSLVAKEFIELAENEVKEETGRARRSFEQWQQKHELPLAWQRQTSGPTTEWKPQSGLPHRVIAAMGALADLVVLQMRPLPIASGLEAVKAALFDTGRPVLLAPSRLPSSLLAEPMLAWKAGPQAARAMAGALPLLRRAGKVRVFAASDKDGSPLVPEDLVPYLEWHGIAAEAPSFERGASSIGEALLAEAARAGATLLVLGAYGHSRLRETILGGVTQYVLEHATVPVLMAH